MKIPDYIRRAVDKPELAMDNDYVLLSQLRLLFEDAQTLTNLSFTGQIFESAIPGAAYVSPRPTPPSYVPERANPTTDDGVLMLLRQLQEEIDCFEKEHGPKRALERVKQALNERLSRDLDYKIAPSHLIIPLSEGIKLEDYGCVLSLPPLPKAVLVLFLRHPKGIVLKQRESYYNELCSIYGLFCKKGNLNEVEDSCKKLVNVTDGSMDEKISVVNSVFKKNLTFDLAEKYQILGKRGEVKSIQLDRSLVKLPKELDRIPLTVLK